MILARARQVVPKIAGSSRVTTATRQRRVHGTFRRGKATRHVTHVVQAVAPDEETRPSKSLGRAKASPARCTPRFGPGPVVTATLVTFETTEYRYCADRRYNAAASSGSAYCWPSWTYPLASWLCRARKAWITAALYDTGGHDVVYVRINITRGNCMALTSITEQFRLQAAFEN